MQRVLQEAWEHYVKSTNKQFTNGMEHCIADEGHKHWIHVH